MGRPALSKKDVTVKTTLRLTQGVLNRIVALVGPNKIAAFIRDAIEEKLRRDERRQSGKGATEGEQP